MYLAGAEDQESGISLFDSFSGNNSGIEEENLDGNFEFTGIGSSSDASELDQLTSSPWGAVDEGESVKWLDEVGWEGSGASSAVDWTTGPTTPLQTPETPCMDVLSWTSVNHLAGSCGTTSSPTIHCLTDVLKLLHPSTVDGQRLPVRPARIPDDSMLQGPLLFRESRRKHDRRRDVGVGSTVDRWRSSGGKRHVVLLPLPKHLQADDTHTLLAVRHGYVVRPDGCERLSWRKWQLAESKPDGKIRAADITLFQACTEAQAKQLFRQPLNFVFTVKPEPKGKGNGKAKATAKANGKGKGKDTGKKRKPEQQLASSRSKQPPVAPSSDSAVEEVDIGLLNQNTQKGLFLRQELRRPSRLKLALSGSLATLALILAYVHGRKNGVTHDAHPGGVPQADGKSCPPNTFSAEGALSTCQNCSVCPPGAMVVSACGDGQDTECMSWFASVELEPPKNSPKPWHLPQFSAVFNAVNDPFNRPVVFGGIGAPTPEERALSPQPLCPVRGPESSSELWQAPCDFWPNGVRRPSCRGDDGWTLLGGNKTSVHRVEHMEPGEVGWPSPRSAAIALDLPAAFRSTVKPFMDRVVLSGAFPPPCASLSQQHIDTEYLVNPNDMWGLHVNLADDSLHWRLFGGEQAWISLSAEAFTRTMVAGQLESVDFNSGRRRIPWPLGRHDSHSWIIGGDVLVFSGAMDLYRRNPSACTSEGSTCMVKSSYLLRDWWTRSLGSLKDNPSQDIVARVAWKRGDSLSITSSAVAHHPGPRVHGATWTNFMEADKLGPQAWLFGGIGRLFSVGGAVHGSAVAAPTDLSLQRLCDMWRFDSVRQWRLVGSCSDNTAELAQHGLAPSGASPDSLAHSTGLDRSLQTRMLLREAVLATPWVDAKQNLWLYGGARCADGSGGVDCEVSVAEHLNPAALSGTAGDSVLGARSLREASAAAQPCSNDLWRFDTTKLTWSVHTYTDYAHDPSTADIARSWPAAECGAVTLFPTVLNSEGLAKASTSVATLALGGWRDQLFSPCQNTSGSDGLSNGTSTPAVCSSNVWGAMKSLQKSQ